MTILLLGLTGCAGVQQRLGWSEPAYSVDGDSGGRPLSRLAFWRHHRAEEAGPSDSDFDDDGHSTMIAGDVPSADDDQPRRGLLRRMPIVGRLWRAGDRDESEEFVPPAPRYGALAMNAVSPSTYQPSAASPAPAPPMAAAEPARRDDQPLRELTVNLAGAKPAVDRAAIPVRNGGPSGEAAPPLPNLPMLQPQQGNLPEPPPVPTVDGELPPPPPSARPGSQPNLKAPDLSPVTNERGTTPPAPAMAGESRSENGSKTTTVISTPGPVFPSEITPYSTGWPSGQSVVMDSPQGGYIAGGCETPCGPKCKKHKLCPFKKHKQTLVASSVVLPSGQGIVSGCEATVPCKVKKPCFLKTWFHHKSGCKIRGCKGCKKCAYCGEPAVIVSGQGPIVSPQF